MCAEGRARRGSKRIPLFWDGENFFRNRATMKDNGEDLFFLIAV